MNHTPAVIITTTCDDHGVLERIAGDLVAGKLAGCVQVSGPITSYYRWQGKQETSREWLCEVKTTSDHMEAAIQRIGELHSYETPEIIAVPVTGGDPRYLDWLAAQVG